MAAADATQRVGVATEDCSVDVAAVRVADDTYDVTYNDSGDDSGADTDVKLEVNVELDDVTSAASMVLVVSTVV